MAAFTSKATGDWGASGQTTWNEVGVPGSGDTVTVTAGHTVTVSDTQATGALTLAVSGASGGVLAISGTGQLTCYGSITGNNSSTSPVDRITIAAGGRLHFDTTGGAITVTLGSTTGPFRLKASGTSGSHCQIKRTNGTNTVYFNASDSLRKGGLWNLTYTDLQYIGGASQRATVFNSANAADSTVDFVMDHCTIDNCGVFECRFHFNSPLTVIAVTNCTWTNSLGTDSGSSYPASLYLGAATATNPPSQGQRTVTGNTFDKALCISAYACTNWDISYNVLKESAYFYSVASKQGVFRRNLVAGDNASGRGLAANGDVTDCYFWLSSKTATNWHSLLAQKPSGTTSTYSGLVFEAATGADGQSVSNIDHDSLILSQSGAGSVVLTNCLVLPGPASYGSGGLMSTAPATPSTVTIEHTTQFRPGDTKIGTGRQGDYIGENVASEYAGCLASYRGNLIWNDPANSSGSCYKLRSIASNWASASPTGDPVDYGAVANIDYNAGYNLTTGLVYLNNQTSTGTNSQYHRLKFSGSTAPGVHDLDGQDPRFVDSTRSLAAWAVARGYTSANTYMGQCADAVTALSADTTRLDDLIGYVRRGFRPTAAAYRNYNSSTTAFPGDTQTADALGVAGNGTIGALNGTDPLAAGTCSTATVTQTTLTVSTSGTAGGTTPYTYQFQRAPDSSGSPGAWANVGPSGSGTSYDDTGLTAGTAYWYRVVVTDADGATSNGAAASARTTAAGGASKRWFPGLRTRRLAS